MVLTKDINIFKISKNRILYNILLFFCFFPYLNIFHLGTDTQPNALIFAIFVIILNFNKQVPKHFILILIIFFISITLFFLSDFSRSPLLSLSNYISLLLVPLSVYFTLNKLEGLSYKFFKVVVYIWFIVALIQKFVARSFLSFLLSRSTGIGLESVSNGRGVVSLSPEPTYYGSSILLMVIIYILNFYQKKDKMIVFILLFQLLILSISSTSILVLFISIIIFSIIQLTNSKLSNIFLVSAAILCFFLLLYLLTPLYQNTRFYNIILLLLSNPQLLFLDQSIVERFNAIYFSIISLTEKYGIPKGFNSYQNYINSKSLMPEYKLFFLNYSKENYSRILSGYGMGLYELGIFGIFIPIFIFYSIKNILNNPPVLFAFILFNLLLFTALSFNNATILFIIGNMLYISKKKFSA